MRILFITPHLSTGGAPQYLLKKIKELNDDHEVYCVEYSNITGGILVVQRNQIEEILGNKLITLGENKTELINYIKNIDPHIIHFEEIPEYFCDNKISNEIYVLNRTYKIIETSHDSSFDVNDKRYFPDQFIFVSEYQKQLFSSLNIPSDIVEYPIEYKTKSDRQKSLIELGLDPSKTHFLNVGLFTSRKNQSEIIDYAKKLINEPVQFHFIGNQADNFKWYWEPLMKDFPSNCKWWGERKDVDTFYNAMDIFLFTSKGTNNDKETNPLVVREAIGWNMPILMYDLEVYMGMYDKYKNINWLANDVEQNLDIIKKFIPKYSSQSTFSTPLMFSESKNNLNLNIWFQEPNKIHIMNSGDPFVTKVSVRDMHTKVPIYFTTLDYNKSSGWYIIPMGNANFKTESFFSGFLLEFYDLNNNLIDSRYLHIRELDYKPVSISKSFSPFDCLYINYKQMFYDDIYSKCDIDNLNTIIDIGANIGLFSLYMIRRNCKRIVSIEPAEKAFSQLKLTLSDELNSSAYKLAIHNFNGKSTINSTDDNTTISGFISDDERYATHDKKEEVDVTTLVDFIKSNNIIDIDLIKIDIEGVEYDVIDSMSDDNIRISDRYLIEYHYATRPKFKERLSTMIDRFKSLGYKLENWEDPSFVNDNGFFYAKKV